MDYPRAGAHYPRSTGEFLAWFRTDEDCLDYLEWLRWPGGFACPRCGHVGGWRLADGRIECGGCGRRTSVTAGTIFDKTRTPLTVWFHACWLFATAKDGISAQHLQRALEIGSYHTAWAMLHRLRSAPRRDQTGGWLPYSEPDQLRDGIEDNLRSLGVEQLAAVNLRVLGDEPDQRFDDQLAAMIQAREDGMIGGVGLSNVTLERLRRALERTPIACVQNPLNLADRSSMPVLQECAARGIAFVPFFPLGSAFAPDNPVLGNPNVRATAERLSATPAQIALAWTLGLAPNVLLIPGTSSVAHLKENLAAADVALDEQAHRELTAAQG